METNQSDKSIRLVNELESICVSSTLSVERLQKIVKRIPPQTKGVDKSSFLHDACSNENVTLEIIESLLDTYPAAAHTMIRWDWDSHEGTVMTYPLHLACKNVACPSSVIELLLRKNPTAIAFGQLCDSLLDEFGFYSRRPKPTPLRFYLSRKSNVDMKVTKILLPPDWAMELDNDGNLPIHYAAGCESPEFCKLLIDSYPESVRVESSAGALPLHTACAWGHVDTVKYLIELYPGSIYECDSQGFLPIHIAASFQGDEQVQIMQYLLSRDPNTASIGIPDFGGHQTGWLPLHFACVNKKNINTVKVLFDAHPEAVYIESADGQTPYDIAKSNATEAIRFLKEQERFCSCEYIADASLLLCCGLRQHATLGAMKLLVQGNHSLLQADCYGELPLHIACELSTPDIVQFLVESDDEDCLRVCDENGDSCLHYACRGANYDVVKYLLDKNVPSVAERNSDNKLPIQLLCESLHLLSETEGFSDDDSFTWSECQESIQDNQDECTSTQFIEASWLLLLAHPEVVSTFRCSLEQS